MQRITLVLLCATVALLSATVTAESKNNDLMVGTRVYGDFLLEQEDVEKGAMIFKVREKTVTLKGNGVAKITRVEAYDLKKSKHSATPSILSGGPGQTFVVLNFKSKRGHGIHYLVKVYGK